MGGRFMAFDILINNFDRLPLTWSNEGNLGNIMLGSSSCAVVGIDQCVNPIKHPAGLSTYLRRVQQVVKTLRKGSVAPLEVVGTAVYNNTAIRPSDGDLDSVRLGCINFLVE